MNHSSVHSLFDSLNIGIPERDSAEKDTEAYYTKIVDSVKHSNKSSICNFLCDGEAIHSAGELAMVLCNHIHKKVTSSVYFDELYKKDIVAFLIKNAEMVYRNASQPGRDISYAFLYKNVFVTVHEEFEKTYIKGLNIYHPADLVPPVEEFEQFRVIKLAKESKIGIIKQSRYGLTVSNLKVETDQTFSFDHYNEDFVEFFNTLTNKLSEKKPGLFLFHGDPGTGKSSAIRYLLSQVKRNFIFIPPQMINQLSTPEFADIITDTNKGSVLILEDAEKALMKREAEDGFSNSALVSSILNLTDGLYADLGNTAIIATYNCNRNLIDSALLRKGRLKAEYKFDKLNREKSQSLMNKLGYNVNIEESMTLADIFNYNDQYTNIDTGRDVTPIGFANR